MSRPSPARLHPAYTRFPRLTALRDRLAALFGPAPAAPRPARLGVEGLEDRVVLDGRPLPHPMIFAGAGAGRAPVVEAYDAEIGELMFAVPAYGPGFTGGVRVAAGDITADGFPDVVVAPGPGRAPTVRVLDGKTGDQIDGPLGSFEAFGEVAGGVAVASADVDGDGRADVVAAAVTPGGTLVRAFSGETGALVAHFAVPGAAFADGVTVAAADLTGDGRAEVVVGSRTADTVRSYNPLTGVPIGGPLGSFSAFGPGSGGAGVHIGADALTGDVNADGTYDLVVGTGPGVPAAVRVFDGKTGAVLREVAPFGSFAGGARAALAYVDDDEYADIVVGTGPGTAAAINVFSGLTGDRLPAPMGQYAPLGGADGGVFVAASNDPVTPGMTLPAANPATPASGLPTTLTVTLTGTAGPTPTGGVRFKVLGPDQGIAYTWSWLAAGAGGTATATRTVSLPPGSYTLVASYAGDETYAPLTTSSDLTVLPPRSRRSRSTPTRWCGPRRRRSGLRRRPTTGPTTRRSSGTSTTTGPRSRPTPPTPGTGGRPRHSRPPAPGRSPPG